ncbi:MAG TPA: hypothetical protein VK138_15665 [Acidiferrobacterales bacterium]|nr:hypothetical protein [Acidiferrobacterales bacterium]
MLVAKGYFDQQGNPCLKISLCGIFNSDGIEFEAIIDTGFTGFISVPLIRAFPIGLPLYGTTNVIFADGSSGSKLTAVGIIAIGDRRESGIVILEENVSDVLIGMDFLRTFKASLVMTKDSIVLLEHDWLEQITKTEQNTASKQIDQSNPAQAPKPKS